MAFPDWRPGICASGDRADRAVPDPRRRRGARRPRRPAGARRAFPTRSRTPAGSTGSRWDTCASWWSTGATRTTGARRKRGSTSSRTSGRAIDGQLVHFVHARSARTDAFPLLLVHGWPGSFVEFARRDPGADRPGAPRRGRRRRVPRDRAVAARLRLLGTAAHARLGPAAHRTRLRRAHGTAGLRAVRRAGRRLGLPGRDADRRPRLRPLRRHPSQHAHRRPAFRAGDPLRHRPSRPRGHAAVPARGIRLRARAGNEAADARRVAQRFTRGAARLDRREVPHVERLRRRPRERCSHAISCSRT